MQVSLKVAAWRRHRGNGEHVETCALLDLHSGVDEIQSLAASPVVVVVRAASTAPAAAVAIYPGRSSPSRTIDGARQDDELSWPFPSGQYFLSPCRHPATGENFPDLFEPELQSCCPDPFRLQPKSGPIDQTCLREQQTPHEYAKVLSVKTLAGMSDVVVTKGGWLLMQLGNPLGIEVAARKGLSAERETVTHF